MNAQGGPPECSLMDSPNRDSSRSPAGVDPDVVGARRRAGNPRSDLSPFRPRSLGPATPLGAHARGLRGVPAGLAVRGGHAVCPNPDRELGLGQGNIEVAREGDVHNRGLGLPLNNGHGRRLDGVDLEPRHARGHGVGCDRVGAKAQIDPSVPARVGGDPYLPLLWIVLEPRLGVR